ncbi:hypothetical protein Mgra_00004477 [Meloidogyne graminicola]|uniref:Activin_recp domain-containing protein n=1 Tax=Meloidogyne graminicola TaxID=189291 RepID=A0A8S9ZQZ4_9BILA|nr:hypothetical protein Mgra_00004477 [Meloidogyne graminicola]
MIILNKIYLFIFIILLKIYLINSIQCYSGNHFSIVECPSLYCIKQTLGLDTVRYCDGTGVSSICTTYRTIDQCQNVPNLGQICCCSEQLCNSAIIPSFKKVLIFGIFGIWIINILKNKLLF